jgi:gluconolactonase
MRAVGMLTVALGGLGVAVLWSQAPPAAKTSGPGVQASADSKEPDVLNACKTPAPARGGGRPGGGGGGAPKGGPGGPGGGAKGGPGGGGAPKGGPGAGARGPAQPRDYSVTEIPGVIAAGAMWKDVWSGEGNNSDGIIATSDGGILIAQNDNSQVLKLDKDGKVTVAYMGLNTSGSVAMSSKGTLFAVNRGLNPSVEELAPKRRTLANKLPNGDPLDCIRSVMNDVVADSKGGVYFTMGGLFHADSKGVVTPYGENLNTNGIMLSADEKHLWVTNGATLAEFDVQKDGSLTNQHEFVKLAGGGDGSTFDAAGRLYVTDSAGIEVISPDGKVLGAIPTPRGVISVTFSGPDRKTLYAVSNDRINDRIMTIPMIAQGPKGRGK